MLRRDSKESGVLLREARLSDLADIREIYAHYVLHEVATFEETPPTVEEMQRRMESIRQADLPYVVAEEAGRTIGYAYAGPYRSRPAYRCTVEDSVYVANGHHRRGVGSALLASLIERCEVGAWTQMIAVIGGQENVRSIKLHERFGFRRVGVLEAVGFKFGSWVDTVLMQRALRR